MLFFLTTDPRSSAGCFVECLAMEAGGVIPTRHASGWMEKKDTQRSLACRIVVRNTFREPLSTLGLAVEKRSNKRQRNEFRSTPSGTSGLTGSPTVRSQPEGRSSRAVHGRPSRRDDDAVSWIRGLPPRRSCKETRKSPAIWFCATSRSIRRLAKAGLCNRPHFWMKHRRPVQTSTVVRFSRRKPCPILLVRANADRIYPICYSPSRAPRRFLDVNGRVH